MEFFMPVLSHFENGNAWTASDGKFQYRLKPSEDSVVAEGWEGPFAYEFSTVEETATFPLSEEGLASIKGWIDRWAQTMNARPDKTLAQMQKSREEEATKAE